MTTSLITSKANPLIQKAIQCRDGKNKEFLFIEGESLFEEALRSDLLPPDVFCTKEKEKHVRHLISNSKSPASRVHVVGDSVMKSISDVNTPPGVIALVRRSLTNTTLPDLTMVSFVLILHRVQLPQNVGALLRTAEAAGIAHVWATSETADPFSAKGIRGSMGSLFRLDVRSGLKLADTIKLLQEDGFHVAAATRDGKTRYDLMNWKQRLALIVGNEAAGFSDEELSVVDSTLTIPMEGQSDSLNVGVAGAICLYEAFRQRGFKKIGA